MMRNRFDRQLELLNNMLIEMGGNIEAAISTAVEALEKRDITLAKKAIAFDKEVDDMEKEIEALCLQLLLQQHPVAGDLRLISAALKMITDMERIGDQAGDIAKLAIYLAEAPYVEYPGHISDMAKEAISMVTENIDAFVKKDLAMAERVIAHDDIVDDYFRQVRKEVISMLKLDNDNEAQAIDLLMISKYLERIGDHAVNIAEWVVFSITGVHNEGGAGEEV